MIQRFRPYLSYLKTVRGPLCGAVLCGLLYGVANGAGLPLMIKWVFPQIFADHAVPLTTVKLLLIALWLPAVFLVRGIAGYGNSYLIQLAGVRVLEALRLDYFRKLQLLPLSFLQRQTTGDLISRGLSDANQLQFTLTTVANDGMRQPASLLGSLGFLVWAAFHEKGVALVLVCLCLVPLCVFPIRYVGKKLLVRAQQIQGQLGSVTNRFSENLSAAKEVRAFGLEEREVARFGVESRGLVTFQMKAVKYAQALTPAIEIISAVGISFTLVYAYRVHVGLDSFLAIIAALYTSYEPIKKLGALNNELNRGLGALDRLEVVLNEPVTITDPADPQTVGRLHGHIAFHHVTFTYGGNGEIPALRGVTAQIPAGTVCALVGPSGAGKSTFANLVPRFYDVGTGAVTIDGLDVRALRLADLRRNIALVSQDPVLFNDTVYNNLLLGRSDATRAEVMAATVDAHAHDFIRAMPNGYDTIVGERGARLSGGQKQRLALAFLRNAPILILDEATSALDSESEAAIQDALRKLVVGKTVLIIAHRFSTIRDASLILVFDKGEIIASGNHAALYAANALYKSLYDRQTAGA